jgi:hypothetical protein
MYQRNICLSGLAGVLFYWDTKLKGGIPENLPSN